MSQHPVTSRFTKGDTVFFAGKEYQVFYAPRDSTLVGLHRYGEAEIYVWRWQCRKVV